MFRNCPVQNPGVHQYVRAGFSKSTDLLPRGVTNSGGTEFMRETVKNTYLFFFNTHDCLYGFKDSIFGLLTARDANSCYETGTGCRLAGLETGAAFRNSLCHNSSTANEKTSLG